jgi:hypothetical protein
MEMGKGEAERKKPEGSRLKAESRKEESSRNPELLTPFTFALYLLPFAFYL